MEDEEKGELKINNFLSSSDSSQLFADKHPPLPLAEGDTQPVNGENGGGGHCLATGVIFSPRISGFFISPNPFSRWAASESATVSVTRGAQQKKKKKREK